MILILNSIKIFDVLLINVIWNSKLSQLLHLLKMLKSLYNWSLMKIGWTGGHSCCISVSNIELWTLRVYVKRWRLNLVHNWTYHSLLNIAVWLRNYNSCDRLHWLRVRGSLIARNLLRYICWNFKICSLFKLSLLSCYVNLNLVRLRLADW